MSPVHLVLPVGLMLFEIVSEACHDSSVETVLLAIGLGVTEGCCQVPNLIVTVAKNLETNFIPLLVRIKVSIPYVITQLSSSTVETLVDATFVTGMALVRFVYRLVKTVTC